MPNRSYDQYCALATALDRIGDRWTLLIVRELMLGPRRYSAIREALPGVATNLLADRLRRMEDDRIVARTREGAYELAEAGRALEPAVLDLVRWGGRWMRSRPRGSSFRAGWMAIALRAYIPSTRLRDMPEAEFRVDGEVINVTAAGVAEGPAPRPGVVVTTDPETLVGIVGGALSLRKAVQQRRASVAGDAKAVRGIERALRRSQASNASNG